MAVIEVTFQGTYIVDVEVPDGWKPTPENLNALRVQARAQADFSDGGAYWDPVQGQHSETQEEYPLD